MTKESHHKEVIGTRSGYVIRFTCPECHHENSIVYNMPRKYFEETRDASCARCKKRYTILTPGDRNRKPVLPPVLKPLPRA